MFYVVTALWLLGGVLAAALVAVLSRAGEHEDGARRSSRLLARSRRSRPGGAPLPVAFGRPAADR